MAKLIPLYPKALPLSPLMIKALQKAHDMQSNNEPFGQVDLSGSFSGLLKRGLIDSKTIVAGGEMEVYWYVTPAGKFALRKLGEEYGLQKNDL